VVTEALLERDLDRKKRGKAGIFAARTDAKAKSKPKPGIRFKKN